MSITYSCVSIIDIIKSSTDIVKSIDDHRWPAGLCVVGVYANRASTAGFDRDIIGSIPVLSDRFSDCS